MAAKRASLPWAPLLLLLPLLAKSARSELPALPLRSVRESAAEAGSVPAVGPGGPASGPAGPAGRRPAAPAGPAFENLTLTRLDGSAFSESGPGPAPPARTFDLTVVLLRGAGWTADMLSDHLRKTARIYAPCGIGLGRVTLLEADPPGGRRDIDWQSCGTGLSEHGLRGFDEELARMLPPEAARPAVFLVRSNIQTGSSAYACPRFAVGSKSPLLDTAFVTAKVHSPSYLDVAYRADRGYDPLAHELAHLLGNRGHNTDAAPNLLHDDLTGGMRTGALSAEQCASFQLSPLLRSAAP